MTDNNTNQEIANKVKATRKINRKCCRNCCHYENMFEIQDSYTKEDLPAWGCGLVNYHEEVDLDNDELFIHQDDIGLPYLMVCDCFELAQHDSILTNAAMQIRHRNKE